MPVPVEALEGLLTQETGNYLWPFFRIAGLLMVAPVFGAKLVPVRVRVALSVAVTAVLVPALPASPGIEPSVAGGLLLVQEVLLGIAMGFTLQMVFDALVIAGQTIAMTMGLGFAMLVDPQRGISVPVLSQFFLIVGILVFLSLDGHLAALRMLAESFERLPIGEPLARGSLWVLVGWGSEMFSGAVRIALPAVVAMLVVNIAFGVMSRAAPTLNLFAVGFPSALLLGFLILLVNVGNLAAIVTELLEDGFGNVARMLSP
jgi:flagellar biosynthetic protein FliR